MALSDCTVVTTIEVIDTSLSVGSVVISAVTLTQSNARAPSLRATWAAGTNPYITGIQFEYQESSLANGAVRTNPQGIGILSWSATDGLLAGKTYAVRYRAVGDPGRNVFGSWSSASNYLMPSTLTALDIVNQGALATLAQVDTAQIVDNAVTDQSVQVRTTGYGGAGQITIAYSVASGTPAYTKVDEFTFTYDGTGDVGIIWTGLLQWTANAARNTAMFLCLDRVPEYSAGDTLYDVIQQQYGSANSSTGTVVMGINCTGLSAGSHTVGIYGRGKTNAANQPYLDTSAIFTMIKGKK